MDPGPGAIGIGIDVGGTKILASAITGSGSILAQARVASPKRASELGGSLVEATASLLGQLAGRRISAVGLALPGLVDRAAVLHAAPNLGAADVGIDLAASFGAPLVAELERSGSPLGAGALAYDNDATCAAYAEAAVGAAAGDEEVLVISFGTGIGAGIVSGGRVLRGSRGFAGEIGHMVIDPDGPECPCGHRGCWERFASGPGLSYLATRGAPSGAGAGPSAEEIVAAARRREPWAEGAVIEFAHYLALGLVNAVELLDPVRIVLGGGLMQAADVLFDPIRLAYVAMNRPAQGRSADDLVLATLGEDAASVGAGLLGIEAAASAR